MARPPRRADELLALDRAGRADAFAGAAVHALFRVNDKLGVAFADSLAGASFLARAALDAIVTNHVSHGFLLLTLVLAAVSAEARKGRRFFKRTLKL